MGMEVRLQKFLADAGVASRRASEQVILEGRVAVNGKVVQTLGTKVDPLHDSVLVDGRPIKVKRKLYIAVNKPPGYICSSSDPESGRILKSYRSHSLVELTLTEGKNREVRRMFETLGFEIERLQRIQIGVVKLGQLPRGKWRTLTAPEIKSLMHSTV